MASGEETRSGIGTGVTGTGTAGTATLVRTLTDTPLSHPNMSPVTFSGKDPRQNASDFWNSVEQKKFLLRYNVTYRPHSINKSSK